MWEWTIKNAEHQRIYAFELWCWRRLLRIPWTARISNQSILEEISPENFCCLVGQSCLTICNPIEFSIPGLSVLNYVPVCSNSCLLSTWCHPTISSPVIPLSSCLQSFPTSESFPVSHLFTSGGQNNEASALASVLPVDIQGWFPLWLTSLIFFQPKGFSRVFSSTTVWKHQFFGIQPSLWFNCHIHTWLLEKPHSFD